MTSAHANFLVAPRLLGWKPERGEPFAGYHGQLLVLETAMLGMPFRPLLKIAAQVADAGVHRANAVLEMLRPDTRFAPGPERLDADAKKGGGTGLADRLAKVDSSAAPSQGLDGHAEKVGDLALAKPVPHRALPVVGVIAPSDPPALGRPSDRSRIAASAAVM